MILWAMVSFRETLQKVLAVVEGRDGLMELKNADKVGAGGEAAFQSDIFNGHGSAPKKRFGMVQPDGCQIIVGGETSLLPESP